MSEVSFAFNQIHGIPDSSNVDFANYVCPVCRKDFHTRERALNHIHYRSREKKGKLVWQEILFLTEGKLLSWTILNRRQTECPGQGTEATFCGENPLSNLWADLST